MVVEEEVSATIAKAASMGVSPRELQKLQDDADRIALERFTRSQVWSSTWDVMLTDASEALMGIPSDLLGHRGPMSLRDIFTQKDRLRGIGVILIAIASVSLALLFIFGSTPPTGSLLPAVYVNQAAHHHPQHTLPRETPADAISRAVGGAIDSVSRGASAAAASSTLPSSARGRYGGGNYDFGPGIPPGGGMF
jgi:hypothetical protein